MITLSMPDLPPPNDFAAFMRFLALVADPAASQKRAEQLSTAADECRALIEQATHADAEFAAKKAEHEQALAKAKGEHAAQLRAAQQRHDVDCDRREQVVGAAEQRAKALLEQAQRDADEAATLKADLNRRLALLQAAADPRA
jgi:hypothetical protein